MNDSVERTPSTARILSTTRSRSLLSVHTSSMSRSKLPALITTYVVSGQVATSSAIRLRSLLAWTPIIAITPKPMLPGSVRPTICRMPGGREGLDPGPHRGLGDPDVAGDHGVRATAVALQDRDDPSGGAIDLHVRYPLFREAKCLDLRGLTQHNVRGTLPHDEKEDILLVGGTARGCSSGAVG